MVAATLETLTQPNRRWSEGRSLTSQIHNVPTCLSSQLHPLLQRHRTVLLPTICLLPTDRRKQIKYSLTKGIQRIFLFITDSMALWCWVAFFSTLHWKLIFFPAMLFIVTDMFMFYSLPTQYFIEELAINLISLTYYVLLLPEHIVLGCNPADSWHAINSPTNNLT